MSQLSRPRVLVVTPWFPTNLKPGGGIFVLRDVLMLTKFADVTVVHVGAPQFFGGVSPEPTWSEFEIIRSPFSFSNYASIIQAARTIRRELRTADVLHTMAFEGLTPLRLLWVRKPWIHTEHWTGMIHAPQGDTLRARQVQLWLRKGLKRIDRVVAVSEMLATAMRPWTRDTVAVIGNEVPLPKTLPGLQKWDFSRIRMISVGSLETRKGVAEALEALIFLRRSGIDARLTLIGEGSLEEMLRTRADEAGVADHVFLLGQLPPEQVHVELQKANLALMPTRLETFGVALAEAIGEGLPLVTGDFGGFMDFIDRESTITVPISEINGERLAQAVIDLVNKPDLPARRSIAEYGAEVFSSQKREQKYIQLYAELGIESVRSNQ